MAIVNHHLNGATDIRRNGASAKCSKSVFGRPFQRAVFTSF